MDSNKENATENSPKHPKDNSKQVSRGSLKDNTTSDKEPHTVEEGQEAFVPTPWNPEMIGFPWDFKHKWPITRAERLRELEILSIHYEKTLQRENIIAAKAWHAQFPPGQTVPDEEVIFQDGKIVKESELTDEGGVIWEEGPPTEIFMTGHGAGSTQGLAPPGPPANVTGNTESTYYTRATDSHMYQV